MQMKLTKHEKQTAAIILGMLLEGKDNKVPLAILVNKVLRELRDAKSIAYEMADEEEQQQISRRAFKSVLGIAALTTQNANLSILEYKIKRLVSTEVFDSYNKGVLSAAEKDNKLVKWDAALDKRTCPNCVSRHGRVYQPGNAPACPAHPNCRCILRPV